MRDKKECSLTFVVSVHLLLHVLVTRPGTGICRVSVRTDISLFPMRLYHKVRRTQELPILLMMSISDAAPSLMTQ